MILKAEGNDMTIAASRATYILEDWRIISTRRMDDKTFNSTKKGLSSL